jgi:hypothetical protein
VLGSMALSTATHAGLASTLSALAGSGLPPQWLAEHQQALARGKKVHDKRETVKERDWKREQQRLLRRSA